MGGKQDQKGTPRKMIHGPRAHQVKKARVYIWVAAVGLSAGVVIAQRADTPDTVKNPFAGDPAAIAAGRTLYAQTCQACHGGEARGDRGPALATGNFKHGGEDNDLFQTIRTGVPGTQMPAFSALPTDNIWRIITYLRSLNANSAAANEVVTGDAGAGEQTFWGKGGCASCHEMNGRGSDVGPDLSASGTNSASYLRSVIQRQDQKRAADPRHHTSRR
jgi:cbb3-type cytochrome c oxidase subunit III